MGFNAKEFLKAKFEPRIEGVPVPDLRDFFKDGDEPVWKVRGLTGQELGRANEAAARNRSIKAIVEALAGQADKERAGAIQDLLGVGENVPEDIAKRIEHLVLGSVDPPCTQDLAVRLCEVFPVEFYQLTTKILELTGKGQEPGKPKPSGKAAKSGPPSPSATQGGASSLK